MNLQITGRLHLTIGGSLPVVTVRLCFSAIEINTVGDSDEHVAVGDAVVLRYAHADAVASGVNHRLEVPGGVEPVVDGALGGIVCAGEHGEIGPEAAGIASIDSGLALLRSVMPGVAPVGAGLGGGHQGFADRQFRHPVGLSGLVDEPDHLLPYIHVVCQVGAVPAGGCFRCGGGSGDDRQCHAPAFPSAVVGGNLCAPLRLGDSHPESQHLLDRYRVWVAGGHNVVCTAGADDETAALSHLQGTALVATYSNGRGFRYRGGDGEGCCEDGYRQCGGNAFFHAGHTFPPVFNIFGCFCKQHNTEIGDESRLE